MTRHPTSPAAARLRGAGAYVVYGEFDPDSVAAAGTAADAMFATGTAQRLRIGPTGR